MKGRNLFLIALLIGFLFLSFTAEKEEDIKVRERKVTRVVDGDTLILSNTTEIRLMGVDSTEVGDECSDEAKKWLTEKVNGSEVKVETLGEGTYGRNLSYIFKEDRNINKELLLEGLAYTHYFDPEERYIDGMIEAERKAIENDRGCLWENEITSSNSIHACETGDHVSQVEVVEGEIKEVNHGDGITYLNFEEEHPDNCFTTIVWDSYRGRFKDLRRYENKTVRVEGLVTSYDNKPQIELKDPAQIKVLG